MQMHNGIRATKRHSKVYTTHIFNIYAKLYKKHNNETASVRFCKLDSRGAVSISAYDDKGTGTGLAKFFGSNTELIHWVEGYIEGTLEITTVNKG